MNRPTKLQEMISVIIIINNRNYEWHLKKQNWNASVVVRWSSKALQTHTLRHYKEYDLQLMNLDTTVEHLECTNKDCF